MKHKLLWILLISFMLCSCRKEIDKWEYKVLKITDNTSISKDLDDFSFPNIGNPIDQLNRHGQAGWELVGIYTETATTYANFGKKEYVTGIRENVKTREVNLVFKRKIIAKK